MDLAKFSKLPRNAKCPDAFTRIPSNAIAIATANPRNGIATLTDALIVNNCQSIPGNSKGEAESCSHFCNHLIVETGNAGEADDEERRTK
jgi:hypothetical protein